MAISYNKLREFLADMEHQQWIYWSEGIASKEKLSDNCLKRWKKLWKPYKKLALEEKEQDRKWADKILDNVPMKCPINQCGGIMQCKERKSPDKDLEEYNGDWQSPDLFCSNCGAIYQFQKFKKKGENLWI